MKNAAKTNLKLVKKGLNSKLVNSNSVKSGFINPKMTTAIFEFINLDLNFPMK